MATKFNNAFIFDEPAIGASASSWGSNIFVMHETTETDDTKWNEPHLLASSYDDQVGVATNTNSIEVIVPSAGLNLELYIATDTAADEYIALGVFGKTPAQSNTTGLARRWPGDIDSTNYAQPTDMWVPLQNMDRVDSARVSPSAAEQLTEQTAWITMAMDVGGPALKYDDGLAGTDSVWYMSKRASVYLAGCTSVIVGVKDGSTVSNGMILGRFVG